MTILHLSSAKSWRGGEQQIAYLIEALQSRKVKQWVFCPKGTPLHQYCLEQKIACATYRKTFSVNPYPAYLLAQLIARENIQLVHMHDSHAHSFACIGAQLFGIKTPFVLSRRVAVPIKKNAFSLWKYRHPSIQRIICVSQSIKKILASAVHDQSRLTVVYDGIDLQKFAPSDRQKDLRSEYQIANDLLLIANIAAIEPFKDYFTFVDTAERLLREKMKAHFLIIGGDGGQESALKEYIAQKELTTHFSFTGFRKDVPQILPSIDLLLFTSKMEGLGSSVLDAFACRVPVVATNAGGLPEIVIHQKTGLTASVGDAADLAKQVKTMLTNPDLRQQLTNGATAHLQQFTKTNMGKQTYQVYQQVLNKHLQID